ncbi:hypothetical protein I6F40_16975 [Pseudoalteromonas sp. SWXJ133]|uniref:hypothetical protein n=1 Tax=unclassified Pseudoalteromonas TaxID=194690 RepID=UPI0014095F01|nr:MULTISPECIES: hypothetical protein [unclassified Pseudoalteromonas]MBH0022019.1 hypothetical protein [Pseudoalteromonas sp. SWXJ133]
MLVINLYTAISFSAVLNINTPELQEYLYSRESGNISDVFVKNGDLVNKNDLLMAYDNYESRKYVYSTLKGNVVYGSRLEKGGFFYKGELLFKIKNEEFYGVLSFNNKELDNIASIKLEGYLCSDAYDFRFKVVKVDHSSILVSIKNLDEDLSMKNKGVNEVFYNCN